MKINVKNLEVNYIQYGEGKDIILLHGWGQNIEMMKPVGDNFSDKYRITILDFPGFGQSEEPKAPWTIELYSNMLEELTQKLKIKKPIVIGHSFGGKIALTYAIKYDPKKVVLLASPYKKKIKKESLKLKVLKSLKKVPGLNKLENVVKKHMGSTDYRNASEMMRKILVSHVNLDLTSELKNVKCSTLLIWGTNDEHADYEDALELEKSIKDCGLVTYEGCTHYAYLERLNQTINVLNSFIGVDK